MTRSTQHTQGQTAAMPPVGERERGQEDQRNHQPGTQDRGRADQRGGMPVVRGVSIAEEPQAQHTVLDREPSQPKLGASFEHMKPSQRRSALFRGNPTLFRRNSKKVLSA